ncbi:MAG: DUF4331 domain-containing protein [Lysobacter sp.]|nr:DUF4331 domain-containing protein [Lysobacter sp.]
MKRTAIAAAVAGLIFAGAAAASSHREAPAITGAPKVDGTDFYMFRSYEPGRENFVTFIANYQPLQAPYGAPNYFMLDPGAVYTIHVDNDGNAMSDHVFQFRINNTFRNLKVPVNGVNVSVPLQNIGPFSAATRANLNTLESYFITTENGRVTNLTVGGTQTNFTKPFDNIGTKSIPNYEGYARAHIARIGVPGCASEGRVFVGQRKESFVFNLGEVFDLINTNPLGPRDGEANDLEDLNITTIALELPIACLTNGTEPVIGAWTTARAGAGLPQVSRLSAPLVNEVVIGLQDKDRFNASVPSGDGQFATYVTNPVLPELIQILFPTVQAPNKFPRTDLVAAFLTGIPGLNKPANVVASEMMRLNTSIAPKPAMSQNSLGVLGGDRAGFPNGRRPGDDVIDIELRVLMGALLPESEAPSGQLPFTDGALVTAARFNSRFPYLTQPIPGSVGD